MRVIITGSRDITDYSLVETAMIEAAKTGIVPSEVISGAADGVDKLGELWANNQNIPIERYPADWRTYGKAAGPMRNSTMARNADALVAVWDGISRGTADMINKANTRGLKVYIHKV